MKNYRTLRTNRTYKEPQRRSFVSAQKSPQKSTTHTEPSPAVSPPSHFGEEDQYGDSPVSGKRTPLIIGRMQDSSSIDRNSFMLGTRQSLWPARKPSAFTLSANCSACSHVPWKQLPHCCHINLVAVSLTVPSPLSIS